MARRQRKRNVRQSTMTSDGEVAVENVEKAKSGRKQLKKNVQSSFIEEEVTVNQVENTRLTRMQLRRQSVFPVSTNNNEDEVEKVEITKSTKRQPRKRKEQPIVSKDDNVAEMESEDSKSSTPVALKRDTTFIKDEVADKNTEGAKSTPEALKRQSTFTKDIGVAAELVENAKSTPTAIKRQSTFSKDVAGESVKTKEDQSSPAALNRQSTFTKGDSGTRKTTQNVKQFEKKTDVSSAGRRSFCFATNLDLTSRRSSHASPIPKLKKSMDVSSPGRRTFCFTKNPDLTGRRSTHASPAPKLEKSIGSRIMSSSLKSTTKPGSSVKKTIGKHTTPGPSVKKTIIKNMATPGSAFKNTIGVARKLPDFKAAHQKLFGNMESIAESQKRKIERAQGLLQSPIVPRCALLSSSKKVLPQKENIDSNLKKATPTNRFGFKIKVKKEEASSLVKTKLPPMNTEKIKNASRTVIQGVRTNRRFLLQMEMRQKNN